MKGKIVILALAGLALAGCSSAPAAIFGAVDKALLLRGQVEDTTFEAAVGVAERYCRRDEVDRLQLRQKFDFGNGPLFVVDCEALPPQ